VIGAILDKYEVLQKVGEGGMATVYRGRHTALDRDVAIKVLHAHLSSSSRNRERFAREARAIEHLRHPNILEIYDYSGRDEDGAYIITEFVPGRTLTELMTREGVLPSEVVAQIGLRLSDALAYAHARGILHRDLKPDNVMVRNDGTVKLMDFGIARFLDETQVTLTGALVGSPAFMSPEQAREESLDARSDLFSLGTLLYFLVTGHRPFAGSNPSLILKNIIEGNRPAVTDLAPTMSSSLADVIEQLLSVNRDNRQNTAEDVSDQLRAMLEESAIDLQGPFSLSAFCQHADDYRERLDLHLREHLLSVGRDALSRGDSLRALRMFNRLLSIDEDNQEVLQLVQGLHRAPAETSRRRPAWAFAAGALVLSGAAALLWEASSLIDEPEPEAPAAVVAPPPAEPAVEPGFSEVETVAQPEAELDPPPRAKKNIRQRPGTLRPRRKAVVVPPEEDKVVPPETGRVVIRTQPAGAEVWFEGRNLGNTRIAPGRFHAELAVGSYEFQLKGPLIEDQTVKVYVTPGENAVVRTVEYLPATVNFPREWDENCVAWVDGRVRGTLSDLGYKTSLPHPERPHKVQLSCNGKETRQRFASLGSPEVWFKGPGKP